MVCLALVCFGFWSVVVLGGVCGLRGSLWLPFFPSIFRGYVSVFICLVVSHRVWKLAVFVLSCRISFTKLTARRQRLVYSSPRLSFVTTWTKSWSLVRARSMPLFVLVSCCSNQSLPLFCRFHALKFAWLLDFNWRSNTYSHVRLISNIFSVHLSEWSHGGSFFRRDGRRTCIGMCSFLSFISCFPIVESFRWGYFSGSLDIYLLLSTIP